MNTMDRDVFQAIAKRFTAGDTRAVAGCFCYPTATYFTDDALVYHSEDDLSDALHTYRQHLSRFDYSKTIARVDALSLARGTKQSAWITWQHLDASGATIEESSIRYFGNLNPFRQFQIQLAEYLVAPTVCARVPELHPV